MARPAWWEKDVVAVSVVRPQIEELETQVERLREALETLANPDPEHYHREDYVRQMADHARSALHPEPTEEKPDA